MDELAAVAALPDNPRVLCHTDLGGNILVDEDTGNVAIIDFGSCMISHPAFDLATLSSLGRDFAEACCEPYPELRAFEAGATDIMATFALQDALYGARQDDWSYVEGVLSAYGST